MTVASHNTLRRLDPRWFKAFLAVVECGTHASASRVSAQSQSVISEHMGKIRYALGHDVVVRVGDRHQLTDTGEKLLKYIKRIQDLTDEFHHELGHQGTVSRGSVRCAMSPSIFHNGQIFRLIKERIDVENCDLALNLCANECVVSAVLKNGADFGLLSENLSHPSLCCQPLYTEEQVFVSARSNMANKCTADNLLNQYFIKYPDMQVNLDAWIRHHLPSSIGVSCRSIYFSGEINDVTGATKLVCAGVGSSVFPRSSIEKLLGNGELTEVKIKSAPALSTVYLVTKNDNQVTSKLRPVIQWLLDISAGAQQSTIDRALFPLRFMPAELVSQG